jgi:hypothetical protein
MTRAQDIEPAPGSYGDQLRQQLEMEKAMAEQVGTNGKGEGAGIGHNVADLKKMIQDCAKSMIEIKGERKDLNERAGDIRQKLRDAGVQTAAFDYAVRLFEMEQEARGSYMDTLRLSMEALSVGEQGSLLAAFEGARTSEQADAT